MKPAGMLLLLLLAGTTDAREEREAWYRDRWCADHGGIAPYRLPDNTVADCLTDTHAIEVDFGPGWYGAVGQALHYAAQSGREPGIVLILQRPAHSRYADRLGETIRSFALPIRVWTVKARRPSGEINNPGD